MSKFEPEATIQACWNCRHADKSCVLTSYPGQIRCTLFDQLVYTNQTECLEDKVKEAKKDKHNSFVEGETKKGWDAAEIKDGIKDLSERARMLAEKAIFRGLRNGGWSFGEPEVYKYEPFTALDGHTCHWERRSANGCVSYTLVDDTVAEIEEWREKSEKKEEEPKAEEPKAKDPWLTEEEKQHLIEDTRAFLRTKEGAEWGAMMRECFGIGRKEGEPEKESQKEEPEQRPNDSTNGKPNLFRCDKCDFEFKVLSAKVGRVQHCPLCGEEPRRVKE